MRTPSSIALCCNFYNDAAALRGLLETAAPFFDNLFCINAGPDGARSDDGSIELCEQFGATVVFDDIQKGFGVIRSRLIHDCGCTWAFLMDADERFYPKMPKLHCEGTEHYPENPAPNLSTFQREETHDQGAELRKLMELDGLLAIRTSRRHWFDYSLHKPAQNWLHRPDYQLRIVRNLPHLGYKAERVMHEHLIDATTGNTPTELSSNLFHDHFHLFYRRTQPGKKEENEARYARLERGERMVQ